MASMKKPQNALTKKRAFALDPFKRNLEYLLSADPVRFRRLQFEQGIPSMSFDSNLFIFWHRAERYLFFNPPKRNHVLTESDLYFYEKENRSKKLTDSQKNAFEVLRCIRRIQAFLYTNKPIYDDRKLDYYPAGFEEEPPSQVPDGFDFKAELPRLETMLRVEFKKMALEVMHLTLAALKCDFFDVFWPKVQRGAAFENGSKYNRKDNLAREIERAIKNNPTIKTKQLWAYFEKQALSGHRVIQEVTDEEIFWKGR